MIMPTGADWTTKWMASIAEKLVSFFTSLCVVDSRYVAAAMTSRISVRNSLGKLRHCDLTPPQLAHHEHDNIRSTLHIPDDCSCQQLLILQYQTLLQFPSKHSISSPSLD